MIKRLVSRDVMAGMLLLLVTALGLYLNQTNPVGTAGRMGPGYMPLVVFLILGALGAAVLIVGLRGEPERIEGFAWRKAGLLIAAIVLFGVLLEDFGMAVATSLLVLLSSLADPDQTPAGTAGLLAALLVICWVVFSWGLKINVPFLPPFLTGS